jgi:cytochrome c biogenesis protein
MAALDGSLVRLRTRRGLAPERVVRALGDPRLAALLLVATGVANVVAAVAPRGGEALETPAYTVLLGAVALCAIAGVAVRMPSSWAEWRRPAPVRGGRDTLSADIRDAPEPSAVAGLLASLGYRVRAEQRGGRWAVHGVRRGWSAFARHASHIALFGIVLGVAIAAAFGSETTFSLLRGDQALLDVPRPGFSSAVRLDAFDAEFGSDDRPRRLDVAVTFLQAGEFARSSVIRVNEPSSFDGYQVHAWTYGPAATIRVTTLGGAALLDAAVPLAGAAGRLPAGSVELPAVGAVLGVVLSDDGRTLGVSLADGQGSRSTASLLPGETARVGQVVVELNGYDAWVTLLSRRDPGTAMTLGGASLLCVALAVGLWAPRRRVTVTSSATGMRVLLRGERFDRPERELVRIRRILGPRP